MKSSLIPLLLTRTEVTCNLPSFTVLYNTLSDQFKEFNKTIVQPVRHQLTVPGTADRFITMPAIIPSMRVMGIKVVCAIPSNTSRNLPTHLGMIQLYNLYGELLCQMDAEEITAHRTALCSALAAKQLAKPCSSVLAVLGAGVQARSHIGALRELFTFDEIKIWNRTYARAESLATELNCKVVPDIGEASIDADIIVTATSSNQPLLFRHHVKTGCCIISVGGSSPTTREVGDDIMTCEELFLVADSTEAAILEAGDIVQTGATPNTELGTLISSPIPYDPAKITMFENLGLAFQDVVTATLVYEQFMKRNRE